MPAHTSVGDALSEGVRNAEQTVGNSPVGQAVNAAEGIVTNVKDRITGTNHAATQTPTSEGLFANDHTGTHVATDIPDHPDVHIAIPNDTKFIRANDGTIELVRINPTTGDPGVPPDVLLGNVNISNGGLDANIVDHSAFGNTPTENIHIDLTQTTTPVNTDTSTILNGKPEGNGNATVVYEGNFNSGNFTGPDASSDSILGSWQSEHMGYSSDGSSVTIYASYSPDGQQAQEMVNINGTFYTITDAAHHTASITLDVNGTNELILHPIGGGNDIHMTDGQFLAMQGYSSDAIKADSIINSTYENWATQNGWTVTHDASDRVWQYEHGMLQPGATQEITNALHGTGGTETTVNGLDVIVGSGHSPTFRMSEAYQTDGNTWHIVAQDQYGTNNIPPTITTEITQTNGDLTTATILIPPPATRELLNLPPISDRTALFGIPVAVLASSEVIRRATEGRNQRAAQAARLLRPLGWLAEEGSPVNFMRGRNRIRPTNVLDVAEVLRGVRGMDNRLQLAAALGVPFPASRIVTGRFGRIRTANRARIHLANVLTANGVDKRLMQWAFLQARQNGGFSPDNMAQAIQAPLWSGLMQGDSNTNPLNDRNMWDNFLAGGNALNWMYNVPPVSDNLTGRFGNRHVLNPLGGGRPNADIVQFDVARSLGAGIVNQGNNVTGTGANAAGVQSIQQAQNTVQALIALDKLVPPGDKRVGCMAGGI